MLYGVFVYLTIITFFLLPVFSVFIVWKLYIKILKSRIVEINIPEVFKNEGYKISIVASFSGQRSIPLLALSFNNVNPLLILFNDYFEYRVLLKHRRRYDEIEYIDIYETILTENIVIIFKNSSFTFIGNLVNKENLIKLVKFFNSKGVKLSNSAKQMLN